MTPISRRSRVCPVLVLVMIAVAPGGLYSLYMRPDLMKTPVDRLIENIAAQIEKDPKNATLLVNLARTHAMAYAKKADELEVEKRKPNEPWFGYVAPAIPFGEIIELNADYQKEQKLDEAAIEKRKAAAAKHLETAIANYRKALEIDPENSIAELGLAWTLDQAGQDEEAIELYRKLVAKHWEKEKELEYADLRFRSVVAETAVYLGEHLDAQKDKAEIADLQAKTEKVSKIRRPITPIAIPLHGGDYASVYDPDAAVAFDADGSGQRQAWTWVRPQAGWLVYDHGRQGKITSALQMFGSVTFWCFWENGYQALSALDDNQDGWLRDKELAELAIWQDVNQNGTSEMGEVRALAAFDIAAIDCSFVEQTIDGAPIACNPDGCLRGDGSRLPTYDVILHRTELNANVARRSALGFRNLATE